MFHNGKSVTTRWKARSQFTPGWSPGWSFDKQPFLAYTLFKMSQVNGHETGRRSFLKALLGILGTTFLVSFVYPLLRFLEPPGSEAQGGKTTIKKAEIPAGSAKDIVVNNTPAIIINVPDKGFIALSKVCTHLGCLWSMTSSRRAFSVPATPECIQPRGNVLPALRRNHFRSIR